MTSVHPTPTAEEILAARLAAGLTQTQSGISVGVTCRMWQFWEAGKYAMPGAYWLLYRLQTHQLPQPITRGEWRSLEKVALVEGLPDHLVQIITALAAGRYALAPVDDRLVRRPWLKPLVGPPS